MATPGYFCPNCGAPVPPGARFCQSCGRPTAVPTVPPQGPPPVYPQQGPPPVYPRQGPPLAYPQQVPAAYPQAYVPVRPRRRGGTKAVLILVGILLVLLGTGGILVGVAGTKTQATVTAVTLVDSEEHEYSIEYQFTTQDGKTMIGSESRSGVLDISDLPSSGDTFSVRYLPFYPGFSMRDTAATTIGGVIGIVLGLGLIVIGARIS